MQLDCGHPDGPTAHGRREMEMERKRTSAGGAYRAAAFMSMLLLLTASLYAQESRGRISGRVLDTTKAALAGATVNVTDVARGTTVTLKTNKDGLFQANYLLPGTYEVAVERDGFKKTVKGDVLLQMNETRDLEIVLEVGGMQETVTVSGDSLTVNTSDANMGFTVDQKRLAELPLIHGDPYKIMGLATGLAHSGDQRLDRPYEPTHIIGYAYDGTRSNRSDLLIDGAPSTATANANEVIATYVPPSDLVQEFRVQTATFDAQFGNTEGGVTSIAIKTGTNRLHGSAYYFAEPSDLGANDFFGKARGQKRIDSSSNRPGFSLSGPVRIPGLYDGRDKTFFTVGYERIKDVRPRFDAGSSVWVPDRGPAQRRLLRVLVEHHDLRSADPRSRRRRAVHRAAVRRQHHPGRPDQPGGEDDPGLLLPAQDHRPERQHLRLDAAGDRQVQHHDLPHRPAVRQQEQDVRARELVQARQSLQRLHGQRPHQHELPVHLVPGCGRRRARVQPHDHPQRPLRLQPLRAQLGPGAGVPLGLRPDEAGLPVGLQQPDFLGRQGLPAHRVPLQHHDRHGVRQRLPADQLAHGERGLEQDARHARAEGRRRDAHLPRGQHLRPATTAAAATSSTTTTPDRTAPAARTTTACRRTPRSCSGCPPPRSSSGPRTTPSTPRPGASSSRTTGGSTTS